MKFSPFIVLFLFFFLALIGGVSLLVFRTLGTFGLLANPLVSKSLGWAMSLLPIILITTMSLYGKVHSPVLSFFYNVAVAWLPILLYFTLGCVFLWIIYFIAKTSGTPLSINIMHILVNIVVFIALAATAYGIWNATHIRTVTYTIEAPKLSQNWKGKNIVLISDTHLGIVRSYNFMKKVVGKIQTLNPDIVLVAGDIIDGPIFDYKNGLSPLANLKPEFGVIYTPGNHEAYNTEPEKFYPEVTQVTTMLKDGMKEINGTQIIGLDYKTEGIVETKARLVALGYDKAKPSIAIMHDPKNIEALQQEGITLAVSGHTHCGQFFPITLIVESIYKKYAYGLNQIKETTSITTCGVGTAMSPLRLGTNPEIVLIRVK